MDLFETLGEHIKDAEETKRLFNERIEQMIAFIVRDCAQLKTNLQSLIMAPIETRAKFTDLSDELQFKFRLVCELLGKHDDVFKIIDLDAEYEKATRKPESFR